jgi:lysophospholipase L1-like esterase
VLKALRTAAFFLYNALIVCAVIGVAEFATRAYVYETRGRGKEQAAIVFDRWSAFRISSNFNRTSVHHDAQGFRRDQDVTVEKPANTARIFLIGGSVAYGAESVYPEVIKPIQINNHETIDYYLEQRLNATRPSKHWEVINASVSGFTLNQDLARILSALLRYKPDAVILLDGVNDLTQIVKGGAHYDSYTMTPFAEEFEELTSPHGPRALGFMLSTWLSRNSAMYRILDDRLQRRANLRGRQDQNHGAVPAGLRLSDLTVDEQEQYRIVESHADAYRHAVQQIHRILSLDGIEDIFLLQPTLRVSKKVLVGAEARLAEYDRAVAGRVEIYAYENLYPAIARQLSEDAPGQGYQFLDLTGVFDGMNVEMFTDYCHLTPAGNQAVAERVIQAVR